MILMIDNYDSFTYNLVQYLGELGQEIKVVRNDEITPNDIEKINSFDEPSKLKEFYLEHLENNELSEKGGAGLGFITIAMKSGNKLGVQFNSLNDKFSHFSVEAKVNVE